MEGGFVAYSANITPKEVLRERREKKTSPKALRASGLGRVVGMLRMPTTLPAGPEPGSDPNGSQGRLRRKLVGGDGM